MHHAKKRFGQNFLHDEAVLARLVKSIAPRKNDNMLEIGPGQGAVTALLLEHLDHLTAVEIDRDLIALLKTSVIASPRSNPSSELTLIQHDILKFTLPNGKWRVVGNLPYNISTPLLFHLFDQIDRITDMHFMLQKEVAERICAPVGGSQYGRLSVMSQFFCAPELLFLIGPESFDPAPQVESAFIRLTPHAKPHDVANFKLFSEIVATAFNQRRKTISNSLKKFFTKEDFEKLNINPQKRAQELSLKDFLELARHCI